MKDNNSWIRYPLIWLALLLVTNFAFYLGKTYMQKEAVIKGHAEWVADTSGKPQFKWKECK
jgi:hypothetical protein